VTLQGPADPTDRQVLARAHDGHDDHGHDQHGHGHDHGGHDHGGSRLKRFFGLEAPHSHDAADRVDDALESSEEGIRALKVSLVGLGVTALLQAIVVVFSGSVALLGDTLHNVADALTALPLWVAFRLGKRPASRRYPYGYGRAEDLAGLFIVVAIAASAILAGYESIHRLLDPVDVRYLGAVAGASVIGFIGNELVARYRITVGRRIGSAALVADGMHARTDGLTSLAVLAGAGGVALGWRAADAVVGLVITAAILVILRGVGRDVYRRLMDAVEPALLDDIERVVSAVEGVDAVSDVRVRWLGHQLRAEVEIDVDANLTVVAGHEIAEAAYHALLHDVPRLTSAVIHVSPTAVDGVDHHASVDHHRTR
jgi:cation diffusion facilitator family transporter